MQPCVTAACGLFLPLLWKLLSLQPSNGRDCRNISQLLQQKVQPGQHQMPPGGSSCLLTGQRAEDVHVPLAVPQGSPPSAGMAATDGSWGRGDGLSQNAMVVSAVISSLHSFMSLCMDNAARCDLSHFASGTGKAYAKLWSAVSRGTPPKSSFSDLLEMAI